MTEEGQQGVRSTTRHDKDTIIVEGIKYRRKKNAIIPMTVENNPADIMFGPFSNEYEPCEEKMEEDE